MEKSKKVHHAGRIMHFLLVFCMVLSIVPIMAFANDGGSGETHAVDFKDGSWTVEAKTVSTDKSGMIDALAMDDVITLTGFDTTAMEVNLTAADGFHTTLTVDENGKTSLSAKNCDGLPNETLTFSVVAKSSGNPGGAPTRELSQIPRTAGMKEIRATQILPSPETLISTSMTLI